MAKNDVVFSFEDDMLNPLTGKPWTGPRPPHVKLTASDKKEIQEIIADILVEHELELGEFLDGLRRELGGPGSGYGPPHRGRPGEVGGSRPRGSDTGAEEVEEGGKEFWRRSFKTPTGIHGALVAGGFSISIDGKSPKDGFMVSQSKEGEKSWAVGAVKASDILAYVDEHIDELALEPDAYLGGWVSKGKAYLDVSDRFGALDEAVENGFMRKQIGIYNVKDEYTIYLDYEKHRPFVYRDEKGAIVDPEENETRKLTRDYVAGY